MVLICVFTISISDALPKNGTSNGISLLLNGKLAEPENFIHATNGRLTLIDINSKSGPKTELQFFAYLRREGKIVDVNAYAHNFSVRSIELTEILKSAKVGDDIIIEPANKTNISGRKIIYVTYSMLFPVFNWFPFLNKNKGGC
ncbi:hypothetical protein Dfri01_32490 [Dyadobacter frigoris]|nr:hypothetical protein Dfri01_32490 [Dyadobacter frigoris]